MATDPAHLELAQRWIVFRRLRMRFFDRDLFDEFAWDMLLWLYIADAAGRSISDEALLAELECSMPVGMRWMAHLEKQGDIHRTVTDGDQIIVVLSDDARARMADLMAELLSQMDQVSPPGTAG